jgi:hypothetical protein
VNLFTAEVVTGFLIGAGLWFLGFYVGLGMREDREAERHAKVAAARVAARQGREIVYLMAPPPSGPPTFYQPVTIADPFPRPGLLTVDLGQLADDGGGQAPELPHGPALRPITSPVDLDGAVRLMCIEAEQYVANLIAGTHHAERGHPW